MKRRKRVAAALVIVTVLSAVAYASVRRNRSDAVTVVSESVRTRRLEAVVSGSGKIEAKRSVNISADTMGRVVSLAVNEGDRVTKGQFLLQVDPRNLRSALSRTEASLRATESQTEQLRSALESARVSLKQAQDTLRRQQDLAGRGLTTRETLDKADADVKMREADLRSQEQQIRTQQLRAEQEQATAESARYDLGKVRIESPIDGIVTRRNIEEGEMVMIGTMNNAGTVLLTIADMSIVEAEVEVDETDIPSVVLGQQAIVTIDAIPDRTFTARVTEIGNSPIDTAGQASTQATSFKVVLTLDTAITNVRPGFSCTAAIKIAERDAALSVPIQATTVREMVVDAAGNVVRPSGSTPGRVPGTPSDAGELGPGQSRKEIEGVFVLEHSIAVFHAIKTGIAGDKYFELLSGVRAGDQVVTGPFSAIRELRDGAAVTVDTSASRDRR